MTISSLLSFALLALSVASLAGAVGPAHVPFRHSLALRANTNAEAIRQGLPLLKPRMVPTRVDRHHNRKRGGPSSVFRTEAVRFSDIDGDENDDIVQIPYDFAGKSWNVAIAANTAAFGFPAGAGTFSLFVNPGPVYGDWTEYTPAISSPDGSATLRVRSLACGQANEGVEEGAVLTLTGSVEGVQYYSIDLDCPAGDTVRLNSFVNLPAVDTVSFTSNSGFAGVVDNLNFLAID